MQQENNPAALQPDMGERATARKLEACHHLAIPGMAFLRENKEASDPNSYRHIALTSTLCKLMERLITYSLTYVFS